MNINILHILQKNESIVLPSKSNELDPFLFVNISGNI